MRLAFVSFCTTLLYAGLGSTSTEACTSPEPSLTRVIPNDGAHPSNAAVLIEGPGLLVLPQNLEATIDGEPVAIVREASLDFGRSRAVRFEPPPAPGQAVHLWGNACDLEVFECYVSVDVQYVAEDPDLDPPPPPADLSFDITRYLGLPFPKGAQSCDEPDVRARFDVSLEGADGLMARVVLSHPDEGELSRSVGPAGGDLLLRSRDGAEEEEAPLQGWSLSVEVLDAAGNVSETVEVDEACLWTEGTVHPREAGEFVPLAGGSCDDGSAGGSTGGGEETHGDDTDGADTDDGGTPGSTSFYEGSTGEGVASSGADEPGAEQPPLTDRGCSCQAEPGRAPLDLELCLIGALWAWRRRRGAQAGTPSVRA